MIHQYYGQTEGKQQAKGLEKAREIKQIMPSKQGFFTKSLKIE